MARTSKRAKDSSAEARYDELAASPPTHGLLTLTLNAFYWVDDSLQNQLKKNGWPEISRLQSQVLICLSSGYRRTADIARHMGISRQLVSRSVKELVGMGFLRLAEDPDDKRAKVITPSARGKRIIVCAIESQTKIEETIEDRIGAQNLRQLRKILEMPLGEPLE